MSSSTNEMLRTPHSKIQTKSAAVNYHHFEFSLKVESFNLSVTQASE